MDLARTAGCFDDQFDPHADCIPIGLRSDQIHVQVVMAVPRIQEQHVVELVAGKESTKLVIDVLITVIIDIGEPDTMTFL